MNKLLIATAAIALGLSSAAFAGEGNYEPFPNTTSLPAVTVTATADTGSAAYPAANPALSITALAAETEPALGSNGAVQTANSLPKGALQGTVQYAQAKSANRYFASQAASHYAQARATQPRG